MGDRTAGDIEFPAAHHAPERGASDRVEQLEHENAALREELRALRELVNEDPLTGLKNRRYAAARLEEERSRAARRGGQLSVLAIDVDDFKQINDRYGHDVGDDVLRWLAALVEAVTRAPDVACRMGGDEFLLILPETSPEGATKVVRRIRRQLEGQRAPVGTGHVGVSIGCATWAAGDTVRDLLVAADTAMYRDKLRRKRGPTRRYPRPTSDR